MVPADHDTLSDLREADDSDEDAWHIRPRSNREDQEVVGKLFSGIPSTPTFLQYKKNILRGINFVKITNSVDPESGHSCLVFVQYPCDSPRSAWELQKKIGTARHSRTNYKIITKKDREGN